MALSLKELIITYQANAAPVIDALNRIDAKLKTTSQQLRSTGESFTRMGTELGLMLSLPLALFGKASVNALADMQSLEAGFSSVMEKFKTGLPIEEATTQELQFLKQTASELGVSFQTIAKPYLQYLASSRDTLEVSRQTIKAFLGVGSALGMTRPQVELMIKALQQMQSKGQVMAEELKLQLGDSLPGALGLFAKAAGVSTEEFIKLMEAGKVSSTILTDVADVINREWGGAIEKGAKTIRANMNRVSDALYAVRVEVGKGLDEFTGLNNKLGALAEWLQRVASNFSRLDKDGKAIILTVGLVAAAIGPVLLVLGGLIRLAGLAMAGIRGLGWAFRFMMGPIGWIITLFAILYTQWEDFKVVVDALGKSLMGIFSSDNTKTKEFIEDLKVMFGWLGDILGLIPKFFEFFQKVGNFAADKINAKLDLEAGITPRSITTGQAFTPASSSVSNTKTTKNNLTFNFAAGTSASDAKSIQEAVKNALGQANKNAYMELGI